jgi:ATP-dependent 26S proteasome regulatory subunit
MAMLLYTFVFSWFLFVVLFFYYVMQQHIEKWLRSPKMIGSDIAVLLKRHFGTAEYDELDIHSYKFFQRMNVVIYRELKKIFAEKESVQLIGIGGISVYSISMEECLTSRSIVPLTFIKLGSIDYEDEQQYMRSGLWLWKENGVPMSLLLGHDSDATLIEITIPKNLSATVEANRIMNYLRQHCTSPLGEYVVTELRQHFGNIEPNDVFIVSRDFPRRIQIELYQEIEKILATKNIIRVGGLELDHSGTVMMNNCLVEQDKRIIPLEYIDIDIGENQPVQCVKCGFWLWRENDSPVSLLYAPSEKSWVLSISIAVLNNEKAITEAQQMMQQLEQSVRKGQVYRHKILSLEVEDDYNGQFKGIKVHQLRHVTRDQLILPKKTLELLDRNIFNFVKQRHFLKQMGLQTKKGLLFYGAPGTGKTHTLHYIIGHLKEEYTTVIITAAQVQYLHEYFQLARLLEPAIVIIEDVDIVGKDRCSSSTESLLNGLLNEMDGLKEDSDILFLLTTNRPDCLEDALRNRPGRIDQAIEFPKPDKEEREKLALLYANGIELIPEVAKAMAEKTEGASAAFIKELLRRSTQFLMERDIKSCQFEMSDWQNALDEMLTGSSFGVLKLEDQKYFL